MANVGTGTLGNTLIATGTGKSPNFVAIGTSSGLTAHGVILGEGSSAFVATAAGTNGQVLIGATGADPAFASLTSSDSSITFTPGANSLGLTVTGGTTVGKTIQGDSGGPLSPVSGNWFIRGLSGSKTSGVTNVLTVKSPPYQDQAGSTTITLNSGSFATAAITLTLPASAFLADGDLFEFVCTTAGALVIQSVGAQKIRIGSLLSGAAGSATSTAQGDSLTLRYNSTADVFFACAVIGTWTLSP